MFIEELGMKAIAHNRHNHSNPTPTPKTDSLLIKPVIILILLKVGALISLISSFLSLLIIDRV